MVNYFCNIICLKIILLYYLVIISQTGKIESLKQALTQKSIFSSKENNLLIDKKAVEFFLIELEDLCQIRFSEQLNVKKGLENTLKVTEKNTSKISRSYDFEKLKNLIFTEIKSLEEFRKGDKSKKQYIIEKENICKCTSHIIKENKLIEDRITNDINKDLIEELDKISNFINDFKAKTINPLNSLTSQKTLSLLSLNTKLMKSKFSENHAQKIINETENKQEIRNHKYFLEFSQTKLNLLNTNSLNSRLDFIDNVKKEKRFVRMIWVSAIVLLLSFFCFLFMKTAIDCAGNSKSNINKLKESQAKEINEKMQKENLIRNNLSEVSE